MKKSLLPLVITASCILTIAHGQTNVSGGIYSNSTWTKANSPYIVTDTVVVFPGVTLTIQPGVTVQFDNNVLLEIRQSRLIAIGNAADSIRFTSNSSSPAPSSYVGIYLNGGTLASQFNYCDFRYADKAIFGGNSSTTVKNSKCTYNNNGITSYSIDSCIAQNNINLGLSGTIVNYCNSSNNGTGIQGGTVTNCTADSNQYGIGGGAILNCIARYNQTGISAGGLVNNCIIKYNQSGVLSAGGQSRIKNSTIDSNTVEGIKIFYTWGDSVYNCQIRYNGIGIYDSAYGGTKIIKNYIENNSIGIRLGTDYDTIFCNKICNNINFGLVYYGGPNNTNVKNNYWCTPDSASTTAVIYDGYDNINLGLVNFMPLDSCYQTGCNLSISANVVNATCATCPNGSATAIISNGFSPYTYTWYTSPIQVTQTATGLAPGTYTICVIDANGCTACDSVFVDSTYCLGSISLSASAANASCSACPDGSATANIIGGQPPYSYAWSPTSGSTQTITNLLPGNYSVCVTDALGCTACSFATVGTGTCSASFNLYPDTIPQTYIAVNTASGAAPITYSWNWGDGSPASSGPTPSHTYTVAGNYNICLSITDATGCTNTFCQSYYLLKTTNTMIYVNVMLPTPTAINESFDNTSFSIVPNPFSTQTTFQVNIPLHNATMTVSNCMGQMVKEVKNISGQTIPFFRSDLPGGLYFVRLTSDNKIFTGKLVITDQ